MWKRRIWNASQVMCGMLFISDNVVQVRLSKGPSMLPTLQESDVILIDIITPNLYGFERGDVVMSKSVVEPDWAICKRITAMPGDVVCLNPLELDEKNRKFVLVPSNCVWLQGDNPEQSRDSRTYGPVPMAMLKGKMAYRVR